jgi:hypothetical protein
MYEDMEFRSKVVCIKYYHAQSVNVEFLPLNIYKAELDTYAWKERGGSHCIKTKNNHWFSPLWKTNADKSHPHFKEYFRIVYDARLAGEKPDCPDES